MSQKLIITRGLPASDAGEIDLETLQSEEVTDDI